jgi:hypothetical protein
MSNQEVRQWYLSQVSKIPFLCEEWTKRGVSAEQCARRAWQLRHDARLKAREMMENPKEVKLLQDRDMKFYGSPDGPTFEFLVEEAGKLGLKGDKMYEAIVADSFTTNADIDKKFGA